MHFFMCTAYCCGLLETISPLFNTLVDKCHIIKGVLTTERERRRWQRGNSAASSLECAVAQLWNPLSVKASTIQATKLPLCH